MAEVGQDFPAGELFSIPRSSFATVPWDLVRRSSPRLFMFLAIK